MAKISIIVPVYNVESYLRKCIDSILNQSYKDFELILVDDGSPDKCPEICDEYVKFDERIKVIHKENGGLSSARNAGIEKSQGEYLYFVDSDDYIEKYTLEKALKATDSGEIDVVIVGISLHNFHIDRESIKVIKRQPMHFIDEEIYINFGYMISNSMWNYAWDKLYKRSIIMLNNVRYNSQYDKVCEDTVFLYDILPFIHSIRIIDDVCYHYYIRENQSVVKKFIDNRFEKYMGRLLKLNNIIENYCNTKENNRLFIKQYLFCVIWAYENLFNKGCTYSSSKRLNYLRKMKRFDSIVYKNRKELVNEFIDIKNELNISLTSHMAVCLYLKDHIFVMWILHIIVLYKNRWFL